MTRRSSTPLALALALLVVGACASDPDEPEYVERPVSEIYNEAMDTLNEGLYAEAAVKFDEVERQHPYSSWATKAQLMAAYSHYEINAYDDAIIALDRFIELHPSNRDTPYAYYLKGLSYYEQISDIARDQRMTRQALATFRELINRYPNSRYARDAKIKLDLTSDHLAGKDMEIGRYYLRQGHNLAAINRFKAVVEKYQTTTHVPEALHRLTEAYLSLGIIEEARKTAAVLGHNFPGSEWYVDSYQLIEGKQIRPVDEDPWYKVW
jgi:outer membrane protein assembly factor BamD